MSRALGPSAPGCPPVQWHRHRSHGAHVRGLVPGAPLQAPAAYARKVLLSWHLLERPSPDGLRRHASRVIAAGTARWSHPYRPCPRRALAQGIRAVTSGQRRLVRSVLTWHSASERERHHPAAVPSKLVNLEDARRDDHGHQRSPRCPADSHIRSSTAVSAAIGATVPFMARRRTGTLAGSTRLDR